MSAPSFTPGPWKPCRAHEDFEGPLFDIDEDDADMYAARPFVRIEAETCDVAAAHDLFEFDAANAYLIAAAPDLYEALEKAHEALMASWDPLWNLPGSKMEDDPAIIRARAALAKARGEA